MAYNSFINKQINANQPIFQFKKDRNNTTVVVADGLGNIKFQGFDGTNYLTTSQILSVASGTIAANRIGSNLEFYTHPDSVTASTQRMVIDSTGQVQINNPSSNVASLFITNDQSTPNINLRTANGTAVNSPHIHFTRSQAGVADVLAADDLGRLEFRGYQGGVAIEAATIRSQAETVNGASVSGNFQFLTRPTSYAALATRMNISANGNVTISNPVSGVALTIVGGGETITAGNLLLSAGNVNIPATTSAVGQYQINSVRVLHSYGTNNIFAGATAGNFTTTGSQNAVLGSDSGNSLSTGSDNVFIGYQAGKTCSGGVWNVAIGSGAFKSANASQNVVIGYNAGNASTGFTTCTVVGAFALNSTNGGLYNLMLGYGSGGSYTGAESSNICLHNNGVLAESNTLRIGSATGAGNKELNRAFICGIDGVNVGSVAKVLTMASNQLGTATITAGTGILVTPTANTITISTTNGISWVEVTGIAQAMAVDTGYIANNVALVTLTLPAVAVVGDRVRVAGKGAGLWRIAQNAGQVIHFGATDSTVGVGGSVTAILRYDCVELLCITANTDWVVLSSVGNLTVV